MPDTQMTSEPQREPFKPASLFRWAHGPGSALQALAILVVAGGVVAWLVGFGTARELFEAIGGGILVWSVGLLVRRVLGPNPPSS
jgi:hypothetical protein